jgi:hypothetical protein
MRTDDADEHRVDSWEADLEDGKNGRNHYC